LLFIFWNFLHGCSWERHVVKTAGADFTALHSHPFSAGLWSRLRQKEEAIGLAVEDGRFLLKVIAARYRVENPSRAY
jgi:hypothetical protein